MSNVLKISNNGKLSVKVKDRNGNALSSNVNNEDLIAEQIKNAYENGLNKGYNNAVKEMQKKYDEQLEERYTEINNIMTQLNNNILNLEDTFNNLVVETSFIVAEKIIKEAIDRSSPINSVLTESLKKIIGANNVVIKINDEDLTALTSENKNLFSNGSFSKVKFEADDSIERGGCFIETDIGNVDGRINAQLKELRKILDTNLLMNNDTN